MKLAVIVGTSREGRKTINQAKWVSNVASQETDVEVETVDLRDYPIPFFNEPVSPRYNPNREIDPVAQKWLDKLQQADAYIFVTAEYNHSVPAVLTNAIDYVTWEIQRKPAAVVSHGASGGARAATILKEVLSESKAILVPTASSLAIAHMSEIIDENGNIDETTKANPYGPETALVTLVKEIKWYSEALAPARENIKPGF